MNKEEKEEYTRMVAWFRTINSGSTLVKIVFSILMAMGAAYLMVKAVIKA